MDSLESKPLSSESPRRRSYPHYQTMLICVSKRTAKFRITAIFHLIAVEWRTQGFLHHQLLKYWTKCACIVSLALHVISIDLHLESTTRNPRLSVSIILLATSNSCIVSSSMNLILGILPLLSLLPFLFQPSCSITATFLLIS